MDRSREVLLNRKPCARPWQRETDGRRCSQEIGRGRGIRTPDIQLPKLALYQTELYPEDPAGDRGTDAPWYGHAGGRVNARHICATRKSRGRRSYRRPRSRVARPERAETNCKMAFHIIPATHNYHVYPYATPHVICVCDFPNHPRRHAVRRWLGVHGYAARQSAGVHAACWQLAANPTRYLQRPAAFAQPSNLETFLFTQARPLAFE